jgi:pimeloyl-ACP methyl ester carboxylesterase
MARPLRLLFLFILMLAGIYAVLCVLLYLFQRSMIYFPVRESSVPGVTPVRFEMQGATLKVWVVEKAGPRALLYFGGNAEDVGASIARFAERLPHTSLYFVNYRGYGGSTGKPEEPALVADAISLFDRLRTRYSAIDVLGRSLGSGVAVRLASERPVRRLAIVTPFDSLANVARRHVRWLPAGLLIRDRYDSAARAPSVSSEVLILIAESDEIIPRARTDALVGAFRTPPRVIVLRGAGHNTVDLDPRYLDELAIFLDR